MERGVALRKACGADATLQHRIIHARSEEALGGVCYSKSAISRRRRYAGERLSWAGDWCFCLHFSSLLAWQGRSKQAPITNCDRYAASDLDSGKTGVPFEKIDPKIAIPACEEAVRTYPRSTRLIFELGRSYLKGGDFAAALVRFSAGGGAGVFSSA